jgi:uncharacterized membrane protein
MAASRTSRFGSLLAPSGARILPYGLLGLLWALAISQHRRLPNALPGHFDFSGEPLDWVPKYPAYFTLPILATAIFIVIGVLEALALRHPVVDGHRLEGRAADQVRRLMRRYVFFVRGALMAWMLHLEFRLTQLAYGQTDRLGADSYVVAGLLLAYTVSGAWLLLRMARRWLAWQRAEEAAGLRLHP